MPEAYPIRPIGWAQSPLTDIHTAPCQADEGAPRAVLHFLPDYARALQGLTIGDDLVVLTWLDQASRDVLSVYPRGDTARPIAGVFATRSPDRPNPIGLHEVTIVGLLGLSVIVDHLEVVHGTPILDVKPKLATVDGR
jgi:tRNA-Thr(GGU) m(6)t(6)A37 methyltransferase TsaA